MVEIVNTVVRVPVPAAPVAPYDPVVNVLPVPCKEFSDARLDRRRQQLAACSKRNRLKKKAEYECLQNKLTSLNEAMNNETTRLKAELARKEEELKLLKSELAVEKIYHSEVSREDRVGAVDADSIVGGSYTGSRKRSREEELTEELKKRDRFISAIFQLADALPVNPFKDIDMSLIPTATNVYQPSVEFRTQFFKVLSGQTHPQPPEDPSKLPTDTLPPLREPSTSTVPEVGESGSTEFCFAEKREASNNVEEYSDLDQLQDTLLFGYGGC